MLSQKHLVILVTLVSSCLCALRKYNLQKWKDKIATANFIIVQFKLHKQFVTSLCMRIYIFLNNQRFGSFIYFIKLWSS